MRDRSELARLLVERADAIDDSIMERVPATVEDADRAEAWSIVLRQAALKLRQDVAETARLRAGIERHRQQTGHLGCDANPALWALIEGDDQSRCNACGTPVEPGADGHTTHDDHGEQHWCPTCCPHCMKEGE